MSTVALAKAFQRGRLQSDTQYHPTAHHLCGGVIFELSQDVGLLMILILT
jgi:hypothetical protein